MCDGDGMPMMSIDNDDKMLGGHEGRFSGELHCWTDGNQLEFIGNYPLAIRSRRRRTAIIIYGITVLKIIAAPCRPTTPRLSHTLAPIKTGVTSEPERTYHPL